MNREETIALFKQGKTAWNKWAEALLVERANLEKAGIWDTAMGFDSNTRYRMMSRNRSNRVLQTWLDRAYVDFSHLVFHTERRAKELGQVGEESETGVIVSVSSLICDGNSIDFGGCVFPNEATFVGAKFNGMAIFEGAKFVGATTFDGAEFFGWFSFDGARFTAGASFDGAEFIGWVTFNGAEFTDGAYFDGVKFIGYADFIGAEFTNGANFDGAEFTDEISFVSAHLKGLALFRYTKFQKGLNLTGLKSDSLLDFSDAEFSNFVPDFTVAETKFPPRLDHITIASTMQIRHELENDPRPALFRKWPLRTLFAMAPSKEEAAKFRRMKKLAQEDKDHFTELNLFVEEMKARRFWHDKPFGFKNGAAAFWWGLAYQQTSDYGRSLFRPLVYLCAVLVIFTGLFWYGSERQDCQGYDDLSPATAALEIATNNALVLFGSDKTNKLKRSFACLYGTTILYSQPDDLVLQSLSPTATLRFEPSPTPARRQRRSPKIPFVISVLSIFQSLLSLTLIFLFILGLKNMFRIK